MGPFREGWTAAEINAVIERNDPLEVLYVPIVVSMDPPDREWAEKICESLAHHRDERVRANAILGFGHLARTCREITSGRVLPLVAAALTDASAAVRGNAEIAAEDI